ncbi:hypothetical protein HJG43_13770 [Kineosporiaceae bacterium SCSIO 59966]|nr:hypothetical protein HJG43_13770 [Kineosporiaceae bacterium SCSIO 59966]
MPSVAADDEEGGPVGGPAVVDGVAVGDGVILDGVGAEAGQWLARRALAGLDGAAARSVHEAAQEVRSCLAAVRGLRDIPWRSVAAEAFRVEVDGLTAALSRAAGDVQDASSALRAHADAVEDRARELLAVAGRPGRRP